MTAHEICGLLRLPRDVRDINMACYAKTAYENFSMSEFRVTSLKLSLKGVDMSKMLAYAGRRVYK